MGKENRRGLGSVFRKKYRVGTDADGKPVYKQTETWSIRYYYGGKQYGEATGSRKRADAVRLLKKRLAETASGRFLGPEAERVTLREVLALVEADYTNNGRKSTGNLPPLIRRVEDFFGPGTKALSVTTAAINRFIEEMREAGLADATIQQHLALLRRAYNLARKYEVLQDTPYVPSVQVRNTRTNFIEDGDFEAIAEALPEYLRPVVRFAYLTGWRKREILSLKWAQVDWTAKTIRLEVGTTKNDEGRVFPFDVFPELETLILEQREECDRLQAEGRIVPWVFHRDGHPIRDFYTAWRTACAKAGLGRWVRRNGRKHWEGARLHDFRRSAVRRLVRAGVPEVIAMRLTGHKTRAVFDRYNIVNEADLRDGVARLADYREETREPGRKVLPLRH